MLIARDAENKFDKFRQGQILKKTIIQIKASGCGRGDIHSILISVLLQA